MAQPMDTEALMPLITDKSMASDFVTPSYIVHGWDTGSMTIYWSGASATTALLLPEGSIDGVHWCKLISTAQAKKVDDVTGDQMYQFTSFGYKYLRLRFSKQTETTGIASVILWVSRSWGRNR